MFSFNLQPLLNYRKIIEDRKLAEFADKQRRLAEEKRMLEGIVSEKLKIVEQLRNIQQSTFCASDVSFSFSYVSVLTEKEISQQKVVAKIFQEQEKLRCELLETVKDRKVIDSLKDKKFMEFKTGIASLERKAIEETAIQSFTRKKR